MQTWTEIERFMEGLCRMQNRSRKIEVDNIMFTPPYLTWKQTRAFEIDN